MTPKEPVRFLVFGAGAIGSVFAVRLAARHPVAVVARGERLARIRKDGIHVEGATEGTVRPPAAAVGSALAGASLALTVPGFCCTLPRALLATRT